MAARCQDGRRHPTRFVGGRFFLSLAQELTAGTAHTIASGAPLNVIAASERAVFRPQNGAGWPFQATQLAAAEASATAWETVSGSTRC